MYNLVYLIALTDTQFNSLMVLIPTLIASVTGMIVSIINAIKSRDNGKKADEIKESIQSSASAIIEKTDQLHTLANSAAQTAEDVKNALEQK